MSSVSTLATAFAAEKKHGGVGNPRRAGTPFRVRCRTQNPPGKLTALQFTRDQLDRLGLGQELTSIPWNKKHYHLPPSKLKQKSLS